MIRLINLKKIRIAVSVLFLAATGIIFTDIAGTISAKFFSPVTYLQFIPSALQFAAIFSIGSLGFLIIIILTAFYGRVYCSSVCPLGTLQDIISRIAKKKNRTKKYYYSKEFKILRYSILFSTLVLIIAGILFPLILLDPYSNFGRIISQLVRPLISLIHNSAAYGLESAGLYWLYPVDIKYQLDFLILFPVIFFAVIAYLSFTRGRFYCNTICPLGTFLGFLSKRSFYKLSIQEESCTECGLCERVCKSECINNEEKTIDFDRCVGCFNCVSACRSGSIKYRRKEKGIIYVEPTQTKRDFILKTGIYLIAFSGLAKAQQKIMPKKLSKIPINRISYVTPPGSISVDNFNSKCTACHLCVSVCPTHVLQPSYLEYGFLGMLQPFMKFNSSFCTFECTVCTDVCPSGAIQSLTIEEKKFTQLGKAVFIKENCIVETENTACGACSEHCPTKAVKMVDFKGNLKIPEVDNKYCIGCGACEFACPTMPHKSIYIEGNPIHLIAQKREEEKIKEEIDLKEDFPF